VAHKHLKNRKKVATEERIELERQIAEQQPRLKSFIRGRVANREDAEDILQDVMFQWFKTVADAAVNPIENLSAWLYKTARNLIINHGVKRRETLIDDYREDDEAALEEFSEALFSEGESEGEGASPSPETVYLRALVWEELEAALAELPAEQREVFEMTELDDIPVKDIAVATGVPVNTILSRKRYAILHLRKRLKSLYDDLILN
jgi:RNA polymerase sigma factor (sigma-70 family)